MTKYSPSTLRLYVAIEGGPQSKKYTAKEKQRKNSSLMSSAMIGDCTLEPIAYCTHHRGV